MEMSVRRIKKSTLLVSIILLLSLWACNPSVTTPTATLIPPSPTFTQTATVPAPTALFATITPSPMPPQPLIPRITPDAVQVERWKDYENALAKTILSFVSPEHVLCEWDILGRSDSGRDVYVWALCAAVGTSGISSAASVPALIHIERNGAVHSVEIPGDGTAYAKDTVRLFPAEVRDKFDLYNSGRAGDLEKHLEWRRTHLGEPPLIVLSPTPTSNPTPTEWLPYNETPSTTGCSEFMATLSMQEAEHLSKERLAKRLFEIYLAHYQSPNLGSQCRLEDFVVQSAKLNKSINFLANEQNVDYVGIVQYSVRISEIPSNWVAGNGELEKDGWIKNKGLIIGVTKVNDQYVLKLIGTGP